MAASLTINFGKKNNFFGKLSCDSKVNFKKDKETTSKNNKISTIKSIKQNSTIRTKTRVIATDKKETPEKPFDLLKMNSHLKLSSDSKVKFKKNFQSEIKFKDKETASQNNKISTIKSIKQNSTIRTKTMVIATDNKEIPEKPFDLLKINSRLVSNIAKDGIISMTKVQELAIPHILNGKDCLIKSQTGSGKTLTYALPILHELMEVTPKINRKDGIFVLIVVPTRELALQTMQCFEKLCKACVWVVPSHLIGGEKKKSEKARIRKGVNVLIGTPGRLLDHFDTTNCLSMQNIQYLVIDEADRMLEMGYEQSMKSIMMEIKKQQASAPVSRQSILLSATLTSAVQKLADVSLKNPVTIDVTNTEGSSDDLSADFLATPQNLNQYFMIVPMKSRLITLSAFILQKCRLENETKLLIFFPTQDMVDYHSSLFIYNLARFGRIVQSSLQKHAQEVLSGNHEIEQDFDLNDDDCHEDGDAIRFLKLHGSMSQDERTAVFREFTNTGAGVLLCTDVAARGLDLPKVDWIVQYNGAPTAALYVHRVGRTARANMIGNAVVFLTPDESSYFSMLEQKGISLQEIHMESILMNLTDRRLYQNLNPRQVPRTKEQAATNIQYKHEELLARHRDLNSMASAAFISFIRSYASFPKEAREVFKFHELHLGHVAKSFALRQTPTEIGKIFSKKCKKAEKIMKERQHKFNYAKDKLMRRQNPVNKVMKKRLKPKNRNIIKNKK